jgi:hypothetical protein
VHAELRVLGTRCGRKRVERLMRRAGMRGFMVGLNKCTTRRRGRVDPATDPRQRSFAATEADKIWVADITWVATQEGFPYLAFILDEYSRRIVGWRAILGRSSSWVLSGWPCRGGSLLLVWSTIRPGVQYSPLPFSKQCAEGLGLPHAAAAGSQPSGFRIALGTEVGTKKRGSPSRWSDQYDAYCLKD